MRAQRDTPHAAPAPVTFPFPATETTSPYRDGAKSAVTDVGAPSVSAQPPVPVHPPLQRTKRCPPPATSQ